jgi:DNA-binding transcriptional ArsR family regulator
MSEGEDADDLLSVLGDEDARRILETLSDHDTPMTAAGIVDACDIPRSTVYRKLQRLSDAGLVRELTDITTEKKHTTRYVVDVEELTVSVEDGTLVADVRRPSGTLEDRLAELWSEVRDEL